MIFPKWTATEQQQSIFPRWLGSTIVQVIATFVERVPLLSRIYRTITLNSKVT